MKKKKILFIISDELFVRNYIDTGVYKFLEKIFNICLIANENINSKEKIKKIKSFKGFYKISEKEINDIANVTNQQIWKKINKSSTIRLKKKILLQFNKFYESKLYNKNFNILVFFKKILAFIKDYIKFFYDTNIIFFYIRKFQEKKIQINSDLKKFIEKINADNILLPTTSQDATTYNIIKISHEKKSKNIILIDNWDNLSSKSGIFNNDLYYTVWGKQNQNFAKKIQNIEKKKVFIIGTPRYDKYFLLRNKKIKSHFDFKYILFLASSFRYTYETDILEILDNILENNKKFSNIKLIYRSHPWRPFTKVIDTSLYKNIILDPQINNEHTKKKFSTTFQPNLNYYPSLIKNAEFVISGPTSMIIECAIFYKKILLLNFDDKNSNLTPRKVCEQIEHFKNINMIEIIKKNNYLSKLEQDMEEILQKKIDKKILQRTDLQRKYFLYDDKFSYNQRLKKIINKI